MTSIIEGVTIKGHVILNNGDNESSHCKSRDIPKVTILLNNTSYELYKTS